MNLEQAQSLRDNLANQIDAISSKPKAIILIKTDGQLTWSYINMGRGEAVDALFEAGLIMIEDIKGKYVRPHRDPPTPA